jgi:hypothetical protein
VVIVLNYDKKSCIVLFVSLYSSRDYFKLIFLGSILLAVVPSLNLNATGDTFVPFPDTPTKFRVRAIAMTNGRSTRRRPGSQFRLQHLPVALLLSPP